jgi:hypothetical protein
LMRDRGAVIRATLQIKLSDFFCLNMSNLESY